MTEIEEPKWWQGTPGTLRWAFARIRELEAEAADLYQRMWAQNDRAEKAEAEVERLTAVVEFWKAGVRNNPMCTEEMFAEAEMIEKVFFPLLKGGGRESGGERTDVRVPCPINSRANHTHPVRQSKGLFSAAANPAARCGACGADLTDYPTAASAHVCATRKEARP